ncbi:hypothetical protein IWX46DRAFT_231468 [Phyllosticta citricarpa]|uniref:Uncharacterized protein n=1 Tax=Phyllosticta citricarpa TaxID=55181 RepID=A0ABR1LUM1_9PEZI
MMLSRCDLWQLLSGNAHLWMDRGPCMEANIQLLARIPLRVARFASFSASPFSQDVFAISQKNMQCDCRLLVYVCLSRDLTSDGVVFRTMGLMPRRGNGFGLRKSKQGRIWQRVKKESNRRRLAAEDWAPTENPLGKIWIKKLLQTHLAKGRRAKERRQLPTQSHSHPAAHQNNLSLSPHAPAKGARSPSVETMMMPKKRNSNQPTTTTAASHAILITRPVVPTHSLPQTHHHHYHHYRVLGPAQAKDWQLCQSSPSVRKHHPASCALLNHWAPLFQAPHLPITTTVHTASLTLQQQKHQCSRNSS